MQTGGSKKSWLFDPSTIQDIEPIRNALVHWDSYFDADQDKESTLSIVLDWILEDMPEDLSESVRLVYLEGKTFRAAGRVLGVDHKTVAARCKRGVSLMQDKLLDTAWVAEMLRGYIPSDEIKQRTAKRTSQLSDVIERINGTYEQE